MVKHTPGPWKVMAPTQSGGALGEAEDRGITGESPEGNVVLAETWMYGPGIDGRKITLPASANAESIVACVNACEGIEDPSDLEAEHLRDMLDCQERVVRLLVALRAVVTGVEGVRYGEPIGHIRDIAVVAIQKEEKEGAPNE